MYNRAFEINLNLVRKESNKGEKCKLLFKDSTKGVRKI